MKPKDYPQEHFVHLEREPFFLGRITINKIQEKFNAEIDIVHAESKKIYHHVAMIYKVPDAQELFSQSLQKLSHFLQGKKEV